MLEGLDVLVVVVVLVEVRVLVVVEVLVVVLKESEDDLDVPPCTSVADVKTKDRILANATVFMTTYGQKGRSCRCCMCSLPPAYYKSGLRRSA